MKEGFTPLRTSSSPLWNERPRRLHEAIFENSPVQQFLIDAFEGAILQANRAARDFWGDQAESGRKAPGLLHGQAAGILGLKAENRSGEERDLEVLLTRGIFDPESESAREIIHLRLQDVTDRNRDISALRESREFLQATLDALPAHIAILD